jgi:hypothetical protein
MKIVKTVDGIKKIEDCSDSVALIRIKEILNDHRNALINRLILDLSTYIDYKFKVKSSKEQIQSITERLYAMKRYNLDLDRYDSIVQDILANENTYLNSEPFYKEIDKMISWILRPNQMVLM